MVSDDDRRLKYARTSAVMRSYARRAHDLPYDWYQLSPAEAAEIIQKLSFAPSDLTLAELETRLAVAAILNTGRRLADLYNLRIHRKANAPGGVKHGIFKVAGRSWEWRLPPGRFGADFVDEFEEDSASDEDGCRVNLPDRTASDPNVPTKKEFIGRPPADWPTLPPFSSSVPASKNDSKAARSKPHANVASAAASAGHKKRTGVLEETSKKRARKSETPAKIPADDLTRLYLRRLIKQRRSACLFTIKLHLLRIRVEHFLCEARDGKANTRRISRGLRALERHPSAKLLHQAGGDRVNISRSTDRLSGWGVSASYYGGGHQSAPDGSEEPTLAVSKFYYGSDFIRAGVNRLHARWAGSEGDRAFFALRDYTAGMVGFSLGLRGGKAPFPSSASIDDETGFCVIPPKDESEQIHWRLVWVPEDVRAQIRIYERALLDFISEKKLENHDLLAKLAQGHLIFPSARGASLDPGGLVRTALTIDGIRPRANVGRHWLRTALIGRVSTETLNAFMGHWALGENPWGHGSCLDPLAYRADLMRTLPGLLRGLGWRPLGRLPSHSAAALPSDDASKEAHKKLEPCPRAFRSPFVRTVLGRDIAGRLEFAKFKRALGRPMRKDRTFEMGRLLASAIVNGALLDRSAWKLFVDNAHKATRKKPLRWVDLCPGATCRGHLRWFADPITDKLLGKWFSSPRDQLWPARGTDPVDALNCFLAATELAISVSELAEYARLRWSLRLPAILLDHALGETPSRDIPERRWNELMGVKRQSACPLLRNRRSSVSVDFREQQARTLNESFPEYSRAFDATAAYRRWGSVGNRGRKRHCAEWLIMAYKRRYGRKAWSHWEGYLVAWAVQRLGERRSHGSKLGFAPTTVHSRFAVLANLILPQAGTVAPAQVKEATRQALTLCEGDVAREAVRLAGRDFIDFLSKRPGNKESENENDRHELDAIDVTLAVSSTAVRPDILTEQEFKRFVSKLSANQGEQEFALIGVLAYRAGLRLPEILGLQAKDFVDVGEKFDLVVDHNFLRELKTPHSRRILPLHILLTSVELAQLRSWLAFRSRQSQALKSLHCSVFGPPLTRSISFLPRYEAILVQALHEARRQGKGKAPPTHFEILRHSFASFLLTTFLMPGDHCEEMLPHGLRPNIRYASRRELSEAFLGSERLGKSALHAVSQALGHTAIHRTLESYQHMLGLSLSFYTFRTVEQPVIEQGRSSECITSARPDTPYRAPELCSQDRKTAHQTKAPDLPNTLEDVSKSFPHDIAVDWTHLVMSFQDDWREMMQVGAADFEAQRTIKRWRSIAKQAGVGFFKHASKISDVAIPAGPHPIFTINLLWASKKPPSLRERWAIARYIGNADKSEGASKLASMREVEALWTYLKNCRVHESYMRGEPSTYNPPYTPVDHQFPFAKTGSRLFADIFPRFAFSKQASGYGSPLGLTSDASRNLEILCEAYDGGTNQNAGRRANLGSHPRDHRMMVYALRLFVLLVACFYGIKPRRLPHGNGAVAKLGCALGLDPVRNRLEIIRRENAGATVGQRREKKRGRQKPTVAAL